MKRVALLSAVLAIFSAIPQNMSGQLAEVYTREHIPNKAPVPYTYVREADVMWAKDIYRIIDLTELQNLSLYYPITPMGDRLNLISLLMWGIDNEGVTAYSTDDPKNEFTIPLDRTKVDETLGAGTETISKINVTTGLPEDTVITNERKLDEVKQLLVKEKWFFDRNNSVMNVRIVGFCPIRVYNTLDDNGMPTDIIRKEQTFWVYFPEVRSLLARYEIYNEGNDAQRISFDDFFMQRKFDSYIFAESNLYGNRAINSYAIGMDALLEGERIKEELFNIEHDMWEY
jgi:gliding motility associated protien GldN